MSKYGLVSLIALSIFGMIGFGFVTENLGIWLNFPSLIAQGQLLSRIGINLTLVVIFTSLVVLLMKKLLLDKGD